MQKRVQIQISALYANIDMDAPTQVCVMTNMHIRHKNTQTETQTDKFPHHVSQ